MDELERQQGIEALPPRKALLWPSIEVLSEVTGMFDVAEHDRRVQEHLALPDAAVEVAASNGKDTEFRVRMRAARHQLKQAGVLQDAGYGTWQVSDRANLPKTEEDLRQLVYRAGQQARREKRRREKAAQAAQKATATDPSFERIISREATDDPIITVRKQDLESEYRKLVELHGRRRSHRERYEELADELLRRGVEVAPLPDWL